MREPTIAWWPGKIPAGTSSDAIAGMFDVLPTFVKLGGGQAPTDRKIDGADIWPVLSGDAGAKGPHDTFFYYQGLKLQAVRSGPWKLRLASANVTPAKGKNAAAAANPPAPHDQLYNLETDIGESKNVAEEHPDVVQRLHVLADTMKDDLGLEGMGPGVRPLGRVEHPQPLIGLDGKIRAGFEPK